MLLKRGFDALNKGNTDEAGECCRKILTTAPKTIEAHFLVGLIASEDKLPKVAIQAFGSVTTLDPSHAAGWAHLARTFARVMQPERAADAIEKAVKADTDDPIVQDLIGNVLSMLDDHQEAREWYLRAVEQDPRSPGFNINLASSQIFLGQMDEAEVALERALEVSPNIPQAHWRKAALHRASDHEHLDELHGLMKKFRSNPEALSFVGYGAGKEHEDMGEWEEAFKCFAVGAKAKRKIVEYDEDQEVEFFEAMREAFTSEWAARETPGNDSKAPIFIVGQPRTGTTLVERIITSHSMVHSAGELQQIRMAIRRFANVEVEGLFPPELVHASAKIDPQKIGVSYMRLTKSKQGDSARFVDKMPVNYLYVPIIAKALPKAKIIHLVRNPMDSCFSSFKQLFAEAYFHSYTLEEMARHHVRYNRLMEYWRELLPGHFLDVEYEDVVSDLEKNARRLIDFLELPWEDACLDFHRQDQAVTTASAVQVREKVHTRSVDRWRKYENQLGPLLKILRAEGIVT
jgi:tetratricopeptide (TPR) repeat protein